MELKISVTQKFNAETYKQSLLQSQQGICVVSCENVVVFVQVLHRSNSFKQCIPVYTVYAADLNSPFEPHVIMKSLDQIFRIKFSSDGHQLLIVTSSRHLYLYIKGSALHQWTNTHTSNWCEEEILFVDFFHSKNKPCININDIKVNALYSEKFQNRLHQPSLRSIGNCAQNGFFAITASGLFLACTLNSSGVMEEEESAILGPVRDNFTLATAAFAPNGLIHVAAWKPDIVKCWEVELGCIERERIASKDGTIFGGISINGNRTLKIVVQSRNFFSPSPLNVVDDKVAKAVKVSHLKYTDEEDPNSLLLFIEVQKESPASPKHKAADHQQSSQSVPVKQEEPEKQEQKYMLQRYQLQEKSRTLFQFFLQSSNSEKPNATTTIREWVCQGEWKSSHAAVSVATPTQNMTPLPTGGGGGFAIPYVICVATTDGAVYVINKENMQQMSKYSFPSSRPEEHSSSSSSSSSSSAKRERERGREKQAVSLAVTWTSLHLVALDSTGGLHVLSLLKQSDVGSTWLVYIMLVLEYSLVSGCDWWDILMAVSPASAFTLADRLSDTFHLHPPKIVANLLSKLLVLKNSILRLSSNLHQKSIEARLQAQLSAILKLFHSLRPVTSDVLNVDKNLSTSIQLYIESRNSLEIVDIDKSIDNLLFSCNILDCQIDPALSQDLQILLEFSTDLALYLLLLLVQNPKYELAKEPKTLQYLREILFVARLWFRHSKLVFPQMIRKTDAVDIWAQLYKLLTRLAHIIPNEPDAGFLDDCVILETQVLCREVPLFIPPRGVIGTVSSASPSTSHYPLQLQYHQPDPNPPSSNVNPRPLEGSLSSPHPVDLLYYRFLGTSTPLLQCTRCFAMRGTWWGAGAPSMWEQEWASRCICSGHWAPAPNTQNPTSAA